ncbi:uncharacterized protein LOC106646355, partial [Copidosoma floridanum]|uniref:uncharacterized protein LOC106646355 n=1 Tax=Copidosoma floridanum TaxID=29053 RepID=UPI0006C9A406
MCFSEGSLGAEYSFDEEVPLNGLVIIKGDVPVSNNCYAPDHVDNSYNGTRTPQTAEDYDNGEDSDDGKDEDANEGTLEDIAENVVSSESEAPVSERAASGFSDSPSYGSPRVQFDKIREEDGHVMNANEAADPEDDDDKRLQNRRHHKHDKTPKKELSTPAYAIEESPLEVYATSFIT